MATLENSNILVTGASGFLGGHLCEELLKKKCNIIALFHNRRKSYLSYAGLMDKVEVAFASITDFDAIRNIISKHEINYIFHCAANPIVKLCSTDPVSCFQTNIMGTANILEAARQSQHIKGVMCMDSDKSYGHASLDQLPLREEGKLTPLGIYEVSKACTGFIATGYQVNYGMPIFTVRSANLYGPGDMNLTRLIPGSITRLLNGEPPMLYAGVKDYVREFIYVKDAASAIISLMEKEFKGVINLGSECIHNIGEVMDKILQATNSSLTPNILEKEKTHLEIEQQFLDTTLLKSQLPSYMPTSLEDGLQETVAWYEKWSSDELS